MAQQWLTKPNYVLSVITMGTPMLSCFSGRGSLKANTQWDAGSQSSMYPIDGSSQASFLAGNLYMTMEHIYTEFWYAL